MEKYPEKKYPDIESGHGHDNPSFDPADDHLVNVPDSAIVLSGDDLFEDLPLPDNDGSQCGLGNICTHWIGLHDKIGRFRNKNKRIEKYVVNGLIAILYNIFFIGALVTYSSSDHESIDWCNGVGLLIILTVTVYLCYFYKYLIKKPIKWFLGQKSGQKFSLTVLTPMKSGLDSFFALKFANGILYTLVLLVFVIFLIIDTADDRRRLMSAFGIFILVGLATLFSAHPNRICWRHVFWGLGLQYIFGLFILRWEVGAQIFECLGQKISDFLDFTKAGSSFVFGYLVDQKPFNEHNLPNSSIAYSVVKDINTFNAANTVFYFHILSVIFFFSFCVSMLLYLGAIQFVIAKLGWLLQITIGTTACESMVSAANIFLGMTEAPIMIKPFLSKMTNSELHVVMTGGFATIAGGVLAAYISFNISAVHLISASVMSAPAALVASKILMPETKKSLTTSSDIQMLPGNEANILDAASQGAATAVIMIGNIGGTLIAVLAFIAFINGILGWCGGLIGAPELTFQLILGKIFIPLSGIMGVEAKDLEAVGTLVGIKSFINEFAAYDALRAMGTTISARSKVIATYALCGFSNPASIGIQIASFSTLAPERRGDFAKLAFRAYIAGSMACFLTACVAGSLLRSQESIY